MELQAALQCLHLYSPDPLPVASFYCSTYGMTLEHAGSGCRCIGPGRHLQISVGPDNQLAYAQFEFANAGAWQAFSAWMDLKSQSRALELQALPAGFKGDAAVLAVKDPDGNLLVFTPPSVAATAHAETGLPPATLQHFALRTPSLRHALALFLAPVACFDHQSFEAPDWASMRVWGDHMAALKVPIVWGIGRHDPGNDVFFMARDPDGNLAEISSEIEHCAPGRPAGLWPHEERTLNLWGKAILRS